MQAEKVINSLLLYFSHDCCQNTAVDKWLLVGLSYQDKPLLAGKQQCQLAPGKVQLIPDQSVFRQLGGRSPLPHGRRCRARRNARCTPARQAAFRRTLPWAWAPSVSLSPLPKPGLSLSAPSTVSVAQPAGKACPSLPLPRSRKAAPREWRGMPRNDGEWRGMSGNVREWSAQRRAGPAGAAAQSGSVRPALHPSFPQGKTGATPRSLRLWISLRPVPLARGPGHGTQSRTRQPPQAAGPAGQLSLVLSHSTSILPTAHLLPRTSCFPLVNDPWIFLATQRRWCLLASGAKARSVSELSQPGPAGASSKSEPIWGRSSCSSSLNPPPPPAWLLHMACHHLLCL